MQNVYKLTPSDCRNAKQMEKTKEKMRPTGIEKPQWVYTATG